MDKEQPMFLVDFNKLSEWGLIYKINKEILHPLGLALSYHQHNGASEGALLIDESWHYTEDKDMELSKRLDDLTCNIKEFFDSKISEIKQ